jgi:peptidoglycan-associated lipoprotein
MDFLKEEKMHKKVWLGLILVLVVPGLLFTTSCAKKTIKTESVAKAAEDDAAKKAAATEAARQAELERQRKVEEQRLKGEGLKGKAAGEGMKFEKELIHFDFDKYNLKPDAQMILKRKAGFLRKNANVKVIIEGHCDERGTTEYNLALGDRRANSAKTFLVNLGIAESRLTTISYGEERPLDPANNNNAWAKNRRAQFVIE